ncbi:LPS assembly lipoprotein LptE [Rubritalea tangerina]|uniref:LPS assembly lipoprotein LptE n=1 Tax=Rubritalea tangerina TaxID=430798 RepID=A0ABW4ZBR2_9BACT
MIRFLLAALISTFALTSCAGYKLGNSKPSELSTINTIAVPLFKNKTQEQRLASLVTNSMVDTIGRDGTYRVTDAQQADATLLGTINTVRYNERRFDRFDSLRASEMYMYIVVDWKLVGPQNEILASGQASGRTNFTIEANQQTSRANAFPDAAKATTELIMQRIANGF